MDGLQQRERTEPKTAPIFELSSKLPNSLSDLNVTEDDVARPDSFSAGSNVYGMDHIPLINVNEPSSVGFEISNMQDASYITDISSTIQPKIGSESIERTSHHVEPITPHLVAATMTIDESLTPFYAQQGPSGLLPSLRPAAPLNSRHKHRSSYVPGHHAAVVKDPNGHYYRPVSPETVKHEISKSSYHRDESKNHVGEPSVGLVNESTISRHKGFLPPKLPSGAHCDEAPMPVFTSMKAVELDRPWQRILPSRRIKHVPIFHTFPQTFSNLQLHDTTDTKVKLHGHAYLSIPDDEFIEVHIRQFDDESQNEARNIISRIKYLRNKLSESINHQARVRRETGKIPSGSRTALTGVAANHPGGPHAVVPIFIQNPQRIIKSAHEAVDLVIHGQLTDAEIVLQRAENVMKIPKGAAFGAIDRAVTPKLLVTNEDDSKTSKRRSIPTLQSLRPPKIVPHGNIRTGPRVERRTIPVQQSTKAPAKVKGNKSRKDLTIRKRPEVADYGPIKRHPMEALLAEVARQEPLTVEDLKRPKQKVDTSPKAKWNPKHSLYPTKHARERAKSAHAPSSLSARLERILRQGPRQSLFMLHIIAEIMPDRKNQMVTYLKRIAFMFTNDTHSVSISQFIQIVQENVSAAITTNTFEMIMLLLDLRQNDLLNEEEAATMLYFVEIWLQQSTLLQSAIHETDFEAFWKFGNSLRDLLLPYLSVHDAALKELNVTCSIIKIALNWMGLPHRHLLFVMTEAFEASVDEQESILIAKYLCCVPLLCRIANQVSHNAVNVEEMEDPRLLWNPIKDEVKVDSNSPIATPEGIISKTPTQSSATATLKELDPRMQRSHSPTGRGLADMNAPSSLELNRPRTGSTSDELSISRKNSFTHMQRSGSNVSANNVLRQEHVQQANTNFFMTDTVAIERVENLNTALDHTIQQLNAS